ncbi:MAG: TRAP transporter small permease [Myxococcales bacterium]|nr:TRAP transporter small permease [Myxococcales bacterium]MCB9538134.1 TRAP transporter small permease [Myxococcales bacterium]
MQSNPFRVVFRVVHAIEAALVAAGILLVAGLTVANVIGRSLFGVSVAFAEELGGLTMVWVTFVGLGYAAGQGRHIRMTALFDQLPENGRRGLMVAIAATTAVLCGYLTVAAVDYVGTVRVLGTVTPALEMPLWLAYLAAPVGLGLATLQFALTAVANVRRPGVHLAFDVAEGEAVDDVAVT